jgi:uncharacterized protein
VVGSKTNLAVRMAGFLAFSHGWTWLFWMAAGLFGRSVWEAPGVYFFYIGGAGVFLGGVLMSRVSGGKAGLRDLGRRVFDPRLIPARWWVVILLFSPSINLLAAAAAGWSGISAQPLNLSGATHLLAHPGQLLAAAFFIFLIGPLPEEIGWRGYLLDQLQSRWNAVLASLILAGVWASWHIPLFFLPGYYDAFEHGPPSPFDLFFAIVSVVVIYTWIYNNTQRSILAVIVFHFVQNFSGEMMGLSPEAAQISRILAGLASILVVVYWGYGRLRREANEHEGQGKGVYTNFTN